MDTIRELFKKEIDEGTLIVSIDDTYSPIAPTNTVYFLLTGPDGFFLKGRVLLDTAPDMADRMLAAIKASYAQSILDYRIENGLLLQ